MAECSANTGIKKEQCENHAECMKMIQAVLDGSATIEEMEHFKMNIEACRPCIEGYELEKSLKSTLKDKVEKKCCPEKTIDILKSKIGIAVTLILVFVLKLKIIYTYIFS
jgi:hypothetical protein